MLSYLPILGLLFCAIPDNVPTQPEPTPALLAFQKGQVHLESDRMKDAIDAFELSLRLDPNLVQNHLSIAAAYLALSKDREAIPHLQQYLRVRPSHFLIRMPYAEVLERLGHLNEARRQLESFIAEVQYHSKLADNHLISCHTRLMEIAQQQGDDYSERLHRGIGLYLLARKRVELGGDSSMKIAEELFCKAAAELTLARLERPTEARPCWYLYAVWHQLGQQQPSQRWLKEAEERSRWSKLTPLEKQELYMNKRAKEVDIKMLRR